MGLKISLIILVGLSLFVIGLILPFIDVFMIKYYGKAVESLGSFILFASLGIFVAFNDVITPLSPLPAETRSPMDIELLPKSDLGTVTINELFILPYAVTRNVFVVVFSHLSFSKP